MSIIAFSISLGFMWVSVEKLGIDETVSAGLSFVIANSLQYPLAHGWVFRGTKRKLAQGYGYFLVNAGIGLVVTVVSFAALTAWTSLDYLTARVLVSVVAGLVIFLLNALLNFKRL